MPTPLDKDSLFHFNFIYLFIVIVMVLFFIFREKKRLPGFSTFNFQPFLFNTEHNLPPFKSKKSI